MNSTSVTPFDGDLPILSEIVTDATAEPLELGKLLKEKGLKGAETNADAMVNHTFDILRAKPFDSTFEAQDHAWYCLVRDVIDHELYNLTVGGAACVEVLDMFAKMDIAQPIRVTLRYKQGGKFSGYYYFE